MSRGLIIGGSSLWPEPHARFPGQPSRVLPIHNTGPGYGRGRRFLCIELHAPIVHPIPAVLKSCSRTLSRLIACGGRIADAPAPQASSEGTDLS
jgi:hypothetical protein